MPQTGISDVSVFTAGNNVPRTTMNGGRETVLSTVQNFERELAGPHSNHLFGSSAEASCSTLQDLIHATDQLSTSLNLHLSVPLSNSKLVSLLRQHSQLSHSLHISDQNVRQTIDALRKRPGISYGEDIPLDPQSVVSWCISRLESWGAAAGMEAFKEELEGRVSLVFGGKVLVVDVDFSIDKSAPLHSLLVISSVKTSYAIADSNSPTPEGSSALDNFLTHAMRDFATEVQKDPNQRDPLEAARLGKLILNHLQYLVMLDRLAERKEDGGLRWFVDLDQLCATLHEFAKKEAQVVASSLSLTPPPLDIFLLRSHSFSLPYLTFPSISFLVYLSPLAYLTLVRTCPAPSPITTETFDIPETYLRSYLSASSKGATLATLRLSTSTDLHLFPASMSMPTMTTRPVFSLVPSGSEIEHVFPQTTDLSESLSTPGQYSWVLDFTDGGDHPGIVMSQSRMRDIELVVNPLSSMDQINAVGLMSFGTGSWVDLLLNPSNPVSPERYAALYRSPTGAHPPLQLHLTAPEEPGFLLEKVPVHSMKEVWGILEVVREQCWLNETLTSCRWTTEGLKMDADELPEKVEPTEADLEAVLTGTITPRKIPVNVFLPTHASPADTLFDTPDMDAIRRPRIVMTSPERPPMSGLVEVTVAYDETKPRGISVQVIGAMGATLSSDTLEEFCRRGGTLGLSGRVWVNAHDS